MKDKDESGRLETFLDKFMSAFNSRKCMYPNYHTRKIRFFSNCLGAL